MRINEVMVRASDKLDWVELYNTGSEAAILNSCYIDDILNGGMRPKSVGSITVDPYDYYVVSVHNGLNAGGDEVRLVCDGEEIDMFEYSGEVEKDLSFQRVPDGKHWSAYQSSPSAAAANCGRQDRAWVPGNFEIRVFDVEQGDSQLIVFPSGYSILVDCGETRMWSSSNARRVATKIRAILDTDYVDVAVLSHLHTDHIGFVGTGGFWALLEVYDISFGKFIDRDSGIFVDGANGAAIDSECDPTVPEISWQNIGTVSNTATQWICYATHPESKVYSIREIAEYGSVTQINPPDVNAQVLITAVDGTALMPANIVSGDHANDEAPPGENEFSIGLLVQFGKLSYHTAGDAGGVSMESGWGFQYVDIETPMADLVGHVDIMHVNHHGSSKSTNQYFLDTLSPSAALISCGTNSYGHPAQDVLDRLLDSGAVVFMTNMCDESRDYSNVHIMEGDIDIACSDGIGQAYNIISHTFMSSSDK